MPVVYKVSMSDSPYALFIEDCRIERAKLIGLIEAIQGKRMDPGAPIEIPYALAAQTEAVVQSFQKTLVALNALIDAYDADAKGEAR
ncbi:MAG TPA: hypothetical protein VGM68_07870 [Rhizomicrobium sp.]|jgi:hypothetical protein